MILLLQTNVDHTTALWLIQHGKIVVHKKEVVQYPQRTTPLVQLDAALRQIKKTPRDIQGIIVTRGPGRFSAVRSGLLIANTLSQELGIPVQGVVRKTLFSDAEAIELSLKYNGSSSIRAIKPWYGKKPNITKPKKR